MCLLQTHCDAASLSGLSWPCTFIVTVLYFLFNLSFWAFPLNTFWIDLVFFSLLSSLLQQDFSTLTMLTLGLDHSMLWGAFLCIEGHLAAFLASVCQIPVELPPPVMTTKKSPGIPKCPLGVKLSRVENHNSVDLEVSHDIYFVPDLPSSHMNHEKYKGVKTLKFLTPFSSCSLLTPRVLVHCILNPMSHLLLHFVWSGLHLILIHTRPFLFLPFFFLLGFFLKNNFSSSFGYCLWR